MNEHTIVLWWEGMLAAARNFNKWLGFVPSPFLEAFIGASHVGMKLKMGLCEGQLDQEWIIKWRPLFKWMHTAHSRQLPRADGDKGASL